MGARDSEAQSVRVWALTGAVFALPIALVRVTIWQPDRAVSELEVRWAPPPSTFVEIAGLRVHLRDQGIRRDVHPIVLLHGSGGSLHTWTGWAEGLARHHRVVTFDMPGFGLTGPRPDADYSVEAYVAFLTHLLDDLGIERAILVGRAIGGETAWRFALSHPARVEKLVLVASGGYRVESRSEPVAFRIARSPMLSWLSQRILPRSVVARSLRQLYGRPETVGDALVDRYFELSLRAGNRRAITEQRAQLRPGNMAHRILEVRVPTLILWGERDALFPVHMAERFHRDIQGSQLVTFPGLGHLLQEEDPAATLPVVERFVSSPVPTGS